MADNAETRPIAVITGAAQGIGRRTAETLAERGYRLALNDLHEPDELLAALALPAADVLTVLGDISDEADEWAGA